jgi:hypothetical protein
MIGAMYFSNVRARAPKRSWAACLVLVACAFAMGCDAEPEHATGPAPGAMLGRGGSELDESRTCTDASTDPSCADDEDEDAESSVVVPIGGRESPAAPRGNALFDPRAEPDPIPWTPRKAHGNDA